MELRDYLAVLRKRWISVVLITTFAVAGAAATTLLATPQYQATTRLFFAVPGGESVSDLAQGSSFTEKQMSSYAQVATSPLVLERVVTELGLDVDAGELAKSVQATVPPNTVILEATASSADSAEAAAIANAVGSQLTTVVGALYPERADGSQAVLATTLAPAHAPQAPASPNVRLNIALGLLAGLALGVGVAVVRESMDTKVRSDRDVAQITDRAILGSVFFDTEAATHPIVMVDRPSSVRAESIRRLRTNLQFVEVAQGPRSILVTSSVPMEGKTTTVVNLAVALADAGARVLLVDADLRRPSLAKVMGLEGAVGLTSVLIGQADIADVVQSWGGGRLEVLAAGPIPPNPSELLGTPAMAKLLEAVTENYDVVLLDSPPLLPVTDAAILSKRTDGTLVVAGTDRLQKVQLRSALDALEAVDAHVLGIVLNKITQRDLTGYGAPYAYAYTYGLNGASDDPAAGTSRIERATKSRRRTPTERREPAKRRDIDRAEASPTRSRRRS